VSFFLSMAFLSVVWIRDSGFGVGMPVLDPDSHGAGDAPAPRQSPRGPERRAHPA